MLIFIPVENKCFQIYWRMSIPLSVLSSKTKMRTLKKQDRKCLWFWILYSHNLQLYAHLWKIWILLLSQLFHDWYYVWMFLFCSMKNNLSKSKNKSLKHTGEQSLHFYLVKYFICSSYQGLMLTPIFNTWKSAYNILITIFNYEYFNNPNHTLGWVFSC